MRSRALAMAAAWIAPREEDAAWWVRTVASVRERTIGELIDGAADVVRLTDPH